MKLVLYTTFCPKCKVLEKKLSEKNLVYETVTDVDVMSEKGFQAVPMLEVDGEVMDFSKAAEWVNKL